jgi:hypothetical protein
MGLILVLGAVLFVVIPPRQVAANPNFGAKYLSQSCCVLRGNRAGIYAPSNSYSLPSGVLGLMRVEAQRTSSTAIGLIQIGYGKTNNLSFSDCGNRSTLTNFWEYRVYTQGSTYHCAWLTGEPLVFGAPRRYSILRRGSWATGNETTWGAYLDGTQKLSINILFDGAEHIYVGGELNKCFTCSGLPDGDMHGWYGASGSTPWQRTSTEGGGNWVTVGQATNLNSDGDWAIGGPLPGPFVIHHYY